MYSSVKIACACLLLALSVSLCKSEFVPRNETDGGPCRNFSNNNILSILEELRDRMHMPLPRFNIPILDPLFAEEISLSNFTFLEGLDISMQNISFIGFRGFEVNGLDLNVIGFFLELQLVIPELEISGWHVSNGSLYGLVPVIGEGTVNLTIANVTFDIAGRLNHTGVEWEVPILNMNMSIDGITGGFNNLTDNFFNELLNLSGPEILELTWPGLAPTVEGAVAEAATEFLNHFSIEDLMRMVFAGEMDWSDPEEPQPTTVTGVPPSTASDFS